MPTLAAEARRNTRVSQPPHVRGPRCDEEHRVWDLRQGLRRLGGQVSVENDFDGVALFGSSMTDTTVKGLVTNHNGGDGLQLTAFGTLSGAKITDVRAIGNSGDGIEIPSGTV